MAGTPGLTCCYLHDLPTRATCRDSLHEQQLQCPPVPGSCPMITFLNLSAACRLRERQGIISAAS